MADNTQPPKGEQSPPALFRDPMFLWLLVMVFVFYYSANFMNQPKQQVLNYSELLASINADQIKQVEIRGSLLRGIYLGGDEVSKQPFTVQLPEFTDQRLLPLLQEHNVAVSIKPQESPWWLQLLGGFLPWLLMIAFFVYMSRTLQSRMGGGKGMFGFSQSKARRFEFSEGGATYDDVAGLDEAKQDLGDIIGFLKNPEHFQRLGAKMPKGVLMMGAPGTGKTLLAKATAAEAGVPFFSISGSEFIEMYVGVGASRVRDMFNMARSEAPALIFIDEIDSVGRIRGSGMGGGSDEREQTLNQILAEMDGFEPDEVVVVLAATNRPDVLDPALLRPGRFDRKVILDLPQKKARQAIFAVHTRRTPLAADVDLSVLAAMTVGFSGADIENLVNEAALRAARKERTELLDEDFQRARDKILMGGERKDLMNPSEHARVACHEAGHAITALYSEHADPIQKISIVPRGRALGMTEQRPSEDRHNVDEGYLRARLRVLLGGRCAEKLHYGTITSGAADDLKEATKLARKMVVNWGMSEALGPVSLHESEEHPFLGRDMALPRDYSEATAQLIDQEVKGMLESAEVEARELLSAKQPQLNTLIKALLAKESLEHAEIYSLLAITEPVVASEPGFETTM